MTENESKQENGWSIDEYRKLSSIADSLEKINGSLIRFNTNFELFLNSKGGRVSTLNSNGMKSKTKVNYIDVTGLNPKQAKAKRYFEKLGLKGGGFKKVYLWLKNTYGRGEFCLTDVLRKYYLENNEFLNNSLLTCLVRVGLIEQVEKRRSSITNRQVMFYKIIDW